MTSPEHRRPGSGRRAHRDRHGRGLRGRLVPATVPLARTKAEVFDDLVLDTVETLERRFAKELAGVEFAVEDVPPDLNVYDSDVLEDGEVPLARLLPGRRAGRRCRRGSCCTGGPWSSGRWTVRTSPISSMT